MFCSVKLRGTTQVSSGPYKAVTGVLESSSGLMFRDQVKALDIEQNSGAGTVFTSLPGGPALEDMPRAEPVGA